MRTSPRIAVLPWLITLLLPTVAAAQQTVDGWPGLNISQLQTVYVRARAGHETAGKLLRLEPDAIVMLVNGAERRLDIQSVDRIQRRDSLKNGALIGAAVGVALGSVSAGISDCPGTSPGGHCPGFHTILLASSVAIYSALGTAIDAMIPGRTTLWVAPDIAPTGGVHPSAALGVTLRW